MKSVILSCLLAFLLVGLGSCGIGVECTVVEEIPDFWELVPVDSFLVLSDVVLPNHNKQDSLEVGQEFIITDSIAYQALIPETCMDCYLPPIDFEQFSVTGKYLYARCTETYINRVVQTDDNTLRHIVYLVDGSQCGFVSCENPGFNLARIPKLEAGQTVAFEVKRNYYECDCD